MGVAELIDRCCALAGRFAAGLAALTGADDETTTGALARVQAGGEAWMGGTSWDGRPAIRLSVSNWRTTEADIDRTLAAFGAALRP